MVCSCSRLFVLVCASFFRTSSVVKATLWTRSGGSAQRAIVMSRAVTTTSTAPEHLHTGHRHGSQRREATLEQSGSSFITIALFQ